MLLREDPIRWLKFKLKDHPYCSILNPDLLWKKTLDFDFYLESCSQNEGAKKHDQKYFCFLSSAHYPNKVMLVLPECM